MITLFLHRLLEAARRHRERRLTVKSLSALSDHLLDDLGIARSDILRLADTRRRDDSVRRPPRVQARRTRTIDTARPRLPARY